MRLGTGYLGHRGLKYLQNLSWKVQYCLVLPKAMSISQRSQKLRRCGSRLSFAVNKFGPNKLLVSQKLQLNHCTVPSALHFAPDVVLQIQSTNTETNVCNNTCLSAPTSLGHANAMLQYSILYICNYILCLATRQVTKRVFRQNSLLLIAYQLLSHGNALPALQPNCSAVNSVAEHCEKVKGTVQCSGDRIHQLVRTLGQCTHHHRLKCNIAKLQRTLYHNLYLSITPAVLIPV